MEKSSLLAELESMLFESLSISEITRRLEEKGYEEHRLLVTGYLRALTDLGILVEEEVPPSKIYRYSAERYGDIYDLMREVLGAYQGTEKQEVAVSLLSRLFRRPVFREELRRAGVTDFSSPAVVEAGGAAVRSIARLRGILSIPEDDPALEFENALRRQVETQVTEVLFDALRASLDLEDLVSSQEQTRLVDG